MSDPVINTTAAAFLAGLVTSLHCSAMCGPLLCAALPKPSSGYHVGRVLSYGAVGTFCGAVGQVPMQKLLKSPAVILPWALVLFLVLIAFGLKPKMPKPLFLRKFHARQILTGAHKAKGFMLGILTPLLPCGPLYMLFGASLLSGSAVLGAEFAIAFALGTIPLLWIAHSSMGGLRKYLTPQRLWQIQRGFALVSAVLIAWRLRSTLGFGLPEEPPCPFCETHG
jgi:sulfite exporter TauE/SafE